MKQDWNSSMLLLASSPNSTGAFLWRVYIRQDIQGYRSVVDSKLGEELQHMWNVIDNHHSNSNSLEYLACEVFTPACVLSDHDIITPTLLDR